MRNLDWPKSALHRHASYVDSCLAQYEELHVWSKHEVGAATLASIQQDLPEQDTFWREDVHAVKAALVSLSVEGHDHGSVALTAYTLPWVSHLIPSGAPQSAKANTRLLRRLGILLL